MPQARPAIVASSGADYLRQKAAQQVRKPHDGELAAEIKKFSAAIKKISTSSVEQAGKISSGRPDLEWQASFLISRPKQKELQKILKRFSDAWEGKRRIECTGPDDELSLLDIIDHVLNAGVVIQGSIVISIGGVDLIYLGLNVVLTSVETALRTIDADKTKALDRGK